MGAKFTTTIFSANANQIPINNTAPLHFDSLITDTANWTLIKGSFIADSAYNYIAIGNFFDDLHTDTFRLGQGFVLPIYTYYYIDDVCVSTDSLLTNTHHSSSLNTFKFFPNPTSDQSALPFDNTKTELCTLTLYNHSGQIVRTINNITSDKVVIQKNDLTNGLYYFVLRTSDRVIVTGKLAVD